jgi:hypothetical protein
MIKKRSRVHKRKPYTDALGAIPDEWHEGFACAVAQVARLGYDSVAKSVMVGSGISVATLKANGIEPYDLAPIRQVMRKSRGVG